MTVEIPALPDYCWPVDWACDQEFYDEHSQTPEGMEMLARSEALAAQTLRMLTGYKVGGCPITVRPCQRRCAPSSWLIAPAGVGSFAGYAGWTFRPYVQDGKWLNACGCWKDSCSCTNVSEVPLPGPVGSVESVWLEGIELPPTTYRVDNGNMLVRTDGGSWPVCQDMNEEDPNEGGFFVTYTQGIPADGLAAYAAGRLAREYAAACTGGNCQLPPGVTNIVRQGISMDIATGSFPTGMTGIREVDVFIQFWNPYTQRTGGAEVFSPDIASTRRTTWRV